jgi:hypothetical protein
MARNLRTGHGEAHASEQSARPSFADVRLGLRVRLGKRHAEGIQPEVRA